MITSDAFYNKLKTSILAKDNATSEEVALWLDIEGLCTVESIIQIFKRVDANYHSSNDITDDARKTWIQMAKIVQTSMYGISTTTSSTPLGFPLPIPTVIQYSSNIILKNLFILMFQTHFIDDIVLDEKLMTFANKMISIYGNPHSSKKFSRLNMDKFEIWAELHDRIIERRGSKQ